MGKKALIGLIVCLFAVPAFSVELIFNYGRHNAEPYAFIDQSPGKIELSRGVIKDLAEGVSKHLEATPVFLEIPRKRIEPSLLSGKSHLTCIFNPHWTSNSDQFDWSIPLFPESNWFVISEENVFPVKSFDDLKGRSVGTIHGYYYPPKLMSMFDSGESSREDVKTLRQNILKLEQGRVDTLIGSNILIQYEFKRYTSPVPFRIAEFVASSHQIHCMISKVSPIPTEKINSAFQAMKDSGEIDQILAKYR